MEDRNSSPPTVVVGIDGSRSAVDAALWAVDEAVGRDIPLRLVYAVDPNTAGTDPHDGTVKLVSWLVAAKIGGRDRCIVVVQGPPLPGRDHRPLRVAVSPVPAELS